MAATATASFFDGPTSGMTLCTAEDSLSCVHYDVAMEELEQDLELALPELAMFQEEPRVPSHRASPELDLSDAGCVPIDNVPIDNIRDSEIEIVYENLEDDAMMSIFEELEHELAPAYMAALERGQEAVPPSPSGQPSGQPSPAQEQLLWNLVATPEMMRSFAAHVATAGQAIPVA